MCDTKANAGDDVDVDAVDSLNLWQVTQQCEISTTTD
jgi:hypothetical protein